MTLHELYKKIGPVKIIPHGDNFEIHFEYIKDGDCRQVNIESYNDCIIVWYKDNSYKDFIERKSVPYEENRREYMMCELAYTYYKRIREAFIV